MTLARGAYLAAFLAAPVACDAPPSRSAGGGNATIVDASGDGRGRAIPDAASDPVACRIPPPAGIDAGCGDVPMEILHENCVGSICHHAGKAPAMGLDLLSPCVADRIVGRVSSCNGRLVVDPRVPEESFILEKLTSDEPECGGKSMPYGEHLPPRLLACVRAWVLAVAVEGS